MTNRQESPEFPYRDQQRIREASEEKKYQSLFRDPLSAIAPDSPKLMVDIILHIILFEEGNYFAQDYDERLYFYHQGVYREGGDHLSAGESKQSLRIAPCRTAGQRNFRAGLPSTCESIAHSSLNGRSKRTASTCSTDW